MPRERFLGGNITPALKWKRSLSPQGAAPGFPVPRDPRGSASILHQKRSQGKILPLTWGKKKKPCQRNCRPAGSYMLLFHREKCPLLGGGSGETCAPERLVGRGQTYRSRARISEGHSSMVVGFPQPRHPRFRAAHGVLFQFCSADIFQSFFLVERSSISPSCCNLG